MADDSINNPCNRHEPSHVKSEVREILLTSRGGEGYLGTLPLDEDLDYFFDNIVVPDYVSVFRSHNIADHFRCFSAARAIALMSHPDIDVLSLNLILSAPKGSLLMCPNIPARQAEVEKTIESFTSRAGPVLGMSYSIKVFVSPGPAVPGGQLRVVMYHVHWSHFGDTTLVNKVSHLRNPAGVMDLEDVPPEAFRALGTEIFVSTKPEQQVKIQLDLLAEFARSPVQPLVRFTQQTLAQQSGELEEFSVNLVFDNEPSQAYMSALTAIFGNLHCRLSRYYVDSFAHDCEVYTYYFNLPDVCQISGVLAYQSATADFGAFSACNQKTLQAIRTGATLLGVLPMRHQKLLSMGAPDPWKAQYFRVATLFAYHFAVQSNSDIDAIAPLLENNAAATAMLSRIRDTMTKAIVGEDVIAGVMQRYPTLLGEFWADFVSHVFDGKDLYVVNADLVERAKGVAMDEGDWFVMRSFCVFNAHVVKTNFRKWNKSALSFKIDTRWMSSILPAKKVPYAIFIVVGSHFRGFHVRFTEVARGGIRFIRQPNAMQHQLRKQRLFDETLQLAYTQNLKNKDIPEGGSKGTILCHHEWHGSPGLLFRRYFDALLDLLLPADSVEMDTLGVVNYGEGDERLFLGPDEGTAGFMTSAALCAKQRGYPYWRAFTTGKSPEVGGIPHDTYGMTTLGVLTFERLLFQKAGIDERCVRKVQIGGPDGDLGSNEILMSKDITVGVVDGSGVGYDPVGLDRAELIRLATGRLPMANYDRNKLSPQGYVVTVQDHNVALPSGHVVLNGAQFRNTFHVNPSVTADILVPCGGRPRSIDLAQVPLMVGPDSRPDGAPAPQVPPLPYPGVTPSQVRYQYIVEGANSFVAEEARLLLEQAGVVVLKDASVNKGGVTSSSLEVFAGLAMNPHDWEEHMTVKNGVVPELYTAYVNDIIHRIKENAALEFEILWKESLRLGIPRTTASNMISEAINNLSKELYANIYDIDAENPGLLRKVVRLYCPPSLVQVAGFETVAANTPQDYFRAIAIAYICSRYVYSVGFEGISLAGAIQYAKDLPEAVC